MLVLVVAFAFMAGFSGCKKLNPSYLEANYHIKKGNGYYLQEKYKKAIEEYEAALELDPERAKIYLYLGTSYASVFKPGKRNDERNKDYGEKAIDYLVKANEAFPDDERTVNALGNIYDRMGNFEEAEKIYKRMKEKAPDDPKSFYILADFYSKYGRKDEAKAMYEERIAIDPDAADGYYYYASYAGDQRLWDLSVENHENRILALYDVEMLKARLEVGKLKKNIEQAEGIVKNMETIRRHRSLDKAEKERLIAEAQEKLDQFPKPFEEMKTELEEKKSLVEDNIKLEDEKMEALEDEARKKLADALYTLGVVCWNKSYQTPPNMMDPKERIKTVDKGMEALEKALILDKDNHQAWAFVGLLWRQKIVAEPLKNDQYMVKWKEAMDKNKEIRERKLKREQLQEQLEMMGKAEE